MAERRGDESEGAELSAEAESETPVRSPEFGDHRIWRGGPRHWLRMASADEHRHPALEPEPDNPIHHLSGEALYDFLKSQAGSSATRTAPQPPTAASPSRGSAPVQDPARASALPVSSPAMRMKLPTSELADQELARVLEQAAARGPVVEVLVETPSPSPHDGAHAMPSAEIEALLDISGVEPVLFHPPPIRPDPQEPLDASAVDAPSPLHLAEPTDSWSPDEWLVGEESGGDNPIFDEGTDRDTDAPIKDGWASPSEDDPGPPPGVRPTSAGALPAHSVVASLPPERESAGLPTRPVSLRPPLQSGDPDDGAPSELPEWARALEGLHDEGVHPPETPPARAAAVPDAAELPEELVESQAFWHQPASELTGLHSDEISLTDMLLEPVLSPEHAQAPARQRQLHARPEGEIPAEDIPPGETSSIRWDIDPGVRIEAHDALSRPGGEWRQLLIEAFPAAWEVDPRTGARVMKPATHPASELRHPVSPAGKGPVHSDLNPAELRPVSPPAASLPAPLAAAQASAAVTTEARDDSTSAGRTSRRSHRKGRSPKPGTSGQPGTGGQPTATRPGGISAGERPARNTGPEVDAVANPNPRDHLDALTAALRELEPERVAPLVVEQSRDVPVLEDAVALTGDGEIVEVGEAVEDDPLMDALGELEGQMYAVAVVPDDWEHTPSPVDPPVAISAGGITKTMPIQGTAPVSPSSGRAAGVVPARSASVNSVPARSASVNSVPVNSVPVNSVSVNSVSVNSVPTRSASASPGPRENEGARAAPEGARPAARASHTAVTPLPPPTELRRGTFEPSGRRPELDPWVTEGPSRAHPPEPEDRVRRDPYREIFDWPETVGPPPSEDLWSTPSPLPWSHGPAYRGPQTPHPGSGWPGYPPTPPPSIGYPPQPYPGQTYPGQPYPGAGYPGQTYPGQPYPGAGYPGQPYPGQPYPGQPYPGAGYPGQPYPGQPYPGQPYPGQPYPGQPHPGQPYPGRPSPGRGQPSSPLPGQGYPPSPVPGQGYPLQPYPVPPNPGQPQPGHLEPATGFPDAQPYGAPGSTPVAAGTGSAPGLARQKGGVGSPPPAGQTTLPPPLVRPMQAQPGEARAPGAFSSAPASGPLWPGEAPSPGADSRSGAARGSSPASAAPGTAQPQATGAERQSRSGSERRLTPRIVGPSGAVYYRIQGQTVTAEIVNLSKEGVLISTRTALQPGQSLPLALDLPAMVRPLRLVARIVWVKPLERQPDGATLFAMGLIFEQVAPNDRQLLTAYIARFGG